MAAGAAKPLLPFHDRFPDEREVERLRLLLSTYQDGTGQLAEKGGTTWPGWRDFERTAALAFGGLPQENKGLFDVLLPNDEKPPRYAGISCKMKRALTEAQKADGYTYIEVSNAAGAFVDAVAADGIEESDYGTRAANVGSAISRVVDTWKSQAKAGYSIEIAGTTKTVSVRAEKCCFLVLLWSPRHEYMLVCYPFDLPDPTTLTWSCEGASAGKVARRLVGKAGGRPVVDWYFKSGGQLKFYPSIKDSLWKSPVFELEPLPATAPRDITGKAAAYFPKQWSEVK